ALDAHGQREGADLQIGDAAIEHLAHQVVRLHRVQRTRALLAAADVPDVGSDAHSFPQAVSMLARTRLRNSGTHEPQLVPQRSVSRPVRPSERSICSSTASGAASYAAARNSKPTWDDGSRPKGTQAA